MIDLVWHHWDVVVAALIVARMVLTGFLQPPGRLLSWPMFSRNHIVFLDSVEIDGQTVNVDAIHRYFPVDEVHLEPGLLAAAAAVHLRKKSGEQIVLRGRHRTIEGEAPMTVVVDREGGSFVG